MTSEAERNVNLPSKYDYVNDALSLSFIPEMKRAGVDNKQKKVLDDEDHDTAYLEYLKRTFGTTTIPFFGSILAVVTVMLTLMFVLFFINANETKSIAIVPVQQPLMPQHPLPTIIF
jgi:hypothetical protein